MRTTFRIIIAALAVACFQQPSICQTPLNDLGNQTGTTAMSVYHGTDLEHVDSNSGNLNISLPLLHLPGRGINTDIVLSYNSKIWQTYWIAPPNQSVPAQYEIGLAGSTAINFVTGWTIGVPRMGVRVLGPSDCVNPDPTTGNCGSIEGHLTLIGSDGSQTDLVNMDMPGDTSYSSYDGSYIVAPASAGIFSTNNIYYKDGVRLNQVTGSGNSLQETLTDTNGNFISCSFIAAADPSSCTDTVGRQITFSTDPGTGLLGSMSYLDSQGTSRSAAFHYTTFSLNYLFRDGQYCVSRGAVSFPASLPLLTSITLPNGRSYQFQYFMNTDGSTTGEITKISLPTGGYIRYVYGFADVSNDGNLILCGILQSLAQDRVVTDRYVSPDGTAGSEQHWSYSWSDYSGPQIFTITDPLQNTKSTTRDAFDGIPLPTEIDYKDSSGTLLKSVHYEVESGYHNPNFRYYYTYAPIANARYKSQTTILPNNQQSKITFSYGAFNNIIERDETDWGSGGPGGVLRKTTSTYLNDLDPTDYVADSVNILDRIHTETVCDAGSTFCSQTTINYDSGTIASTNSSPVIQHDYTNFQSTYWTRGNPTQILKSLSTTGGNLTTTNSYNDVGNLIKTVDPNNNETDFSYSDNFANGSSAQPTSAYLTKTTRPVTSGVNHISRMQYYFNTGLPSAACGENFPPGTACATGLTNQPDYQSTSYDLMQRPVVVAKGDGGQTNITYNEAALPLSTSTSTKINGTNSLTGLTIYDGLGRQSETELTSDPSGTVYGLTTYDSLGRKSQVFNPTRCNPPGTNCGESTWGFTSFTYDGLGRTTQVTSQDGGTTKMNYGAFPTITVKDQAGKQRSSRTDGLGRLVEVDEPGFFYKAAGGVTSTGGIPNGGNQSITAGDSLTSLADAAGDHLFSVGSDQHIYQSYSNGSSWSNQDLTALTGGLLAAPGSAVTSFALDLTSNGLGQNEIVAYLCADLDICVMWWHSVTSQWEFQDLGSAFGGVPAASGSSLTSVGVDMSAAGQGKTEFIYYVGANQHVYQFWWSTNTFTWQNQDLTAMTNGALAAPGTPLSSFPSNMTSAGQGLGLSVFYIGANQHIYLLWWNTVNWAWQDADLTAVTNGAVAGTGSKLTTFFSDLSTHGLGYNELAFYTGSNQHIYALWWSTSNWMWQNQDLTAVTGAPLALVNGALASFTDGTIQSSDHVYFIDVNHKLNQLAWDTINWTWTNQDLTDTAQNQTVASNSGLTGYVDGSGEHVFDVGNDLLLDQVSFDTTDGSWESSNPGNPFITLYNYDALGNLLCVEQHGGSATGTGCSAASSADATSSWRIRRFTYDTLSRLISSSNPESNTGLNGTTPVRVNTTYAYDPNGNLLQKTSPAHNQSNLATQTLSYCYDALNRITGKAYIAATCVNGFLPSGTAVASYSYDQAAFNGLTISNGIGRRTGMSDQAGAEAWSYELAGRPKADKRTTNGVSKTTSYTYNLLGSPITMAYPSGTTINYGYNNAGQAISLSDSTNSITYTTLAKYSPPGSLSSMTNGSNLNSIFYYNNRLQPCRITVTTSTSPINCGDASNTGTIMDFTYGFGLGSGDNGNVLSIANNRDATRSQSFTYDALNRIASAQTNFTSGTNCWGESFVIDGWGNLLTLSGVSGYSACTQESGFGVGANVQNQISTNAYDAAGNMTTGGYVYDAENRLSSAGGVTYTYDGDGKRVEKSNGKIYWYGMGSDVLDETDLTGSTTNSAFNEYVFFDGKRTARRTSSNSLFYYFGDQLDTSRTIVQSGQTTPCYDADFYPFGGERVVSNTCPQNYKFTGKERDTESTLDNFGARYYASWLGRWVSTDWSAVPEPVPYADLSDPQSLNLYTYVRDTPVTADDVDGHKCYKKCFPDQKALDDQRKKNREEMSRIWNHPAFQGFFSFFAFFAGGEAEDGAAGGIEEGVAGASAKAASETNSLMGTFGFKSIEGEYEGFTVGRFDNGAEVAARITTEGENTTVSVLGAFNAGGAKSAEGTIGAIEKGVQSVGEQTGASKVTIQALGVVNKKLAGFLEKNGFTKITVKVGKEEVEGYQKTFDIKKTGD